MRVKSKRKIDRAAEHVYAFIYTLSLLGPMTVFTFLRSSSLPVHAAQVESLTDSTSRSRKCLDVVEFPVPLQLLSNSVQTIVGLTLSLQRVKLNQVVCHETQKDQCTILPALIWQSCDIRWAKVGQKPTCAYYELVMFLVASTRSIPT